MNTVNLQGTVVAKEDLRYTESGLAVQELTLAGYSKIIIPGQFPEVDPNKIIEIPWYHRVTFLGDAAEKNMYRELGTGLRVKGALNYSTWESDGKKRSKVNVKGIFGLPFDASGQTRTDKAGQDLLVDALNEVSVIGNLTAAPELRQTDSGKSVSNARLAIHDEWTGANGKGEKTHFIDVTLWNAQADQAAFLDKGALVIVDGRLATDSWESSEGKRYKTYIEGSSCQVVLPKAA